MFTFKRYVPTGLASVGDGGYTEIKIKRKVVGQFDNRTFRISFAVKDTGQRCGFVWVRLTKDLRSDEETRAWLVKHFKAIVMKWQLHYFE